MDDPVLLGNDEPLAALADRMEARSWRCQYENEADDAGRAVLRLQPPGAYGDPGRTIEVEVRDFDQEPHFAYARNSRRPIAPVSRLDRAVRSIVHVHGGTMPTPPQVPEGVLAAFESLSAERQYGRSTAQPAAGEVEE